jgi:hypothetical protein
MAHVFDTTVGGINSTSYITTEHASEYHSDRLHNDDWNGDTQVALLWAASILDYSFEWKGTKSTLEQRLEWPRHNAYSKYGHILGYDYTLGEIIIPEPIEHAQAELALLLIRSDRTLDPDSKGLKSLQVDVIKMEFLKGDEAQAINRGVRAMLEDYGTFIDVTKNSGVVKLVRM